MNKTIYVRDEDVPTWERAKELAGDKLAPVISAALKRYVAENDAQQRGFERLELEYSDADAGGLPRRKAFYGRWVFPPSKPLAAWKEYAEESSSYGIVATTAKGAVVACTWTADEDGESYKSFRVFASFEEGAKDKETGWAVRAALHKIGVPTEELDI